MLRRFFEKGQENRKKLNLRNCRLFVLRLSPGMCCGIPEMAVEILNAVVLYPDTFTFQQLLHYVCPAKMMFPAEHPFSVHYPVRRNSGIYAMRLVHRPADHPGGSATAQKTGDGPIGADSSWGNKAHDFVHPFEER